MVEKNPTSLKHCSGCSSQPHPPQHRSPTELGGDVGWWWEAGGCREGRRSAAASHAPELPAGEERATRCKDKWEPSAPRATGVLAAARLLRVDASRHQPSRSHGDVLCKERSAGRRAPEWCGQPHTLPHTLRKFLLVPRVSFLHPKPGAGGGGGPAQPAPEQALRCAALRGGGQQHFHTDIFFHWLQFGAAKSQNKNGNIPFFWQKFNAGWFFFSFGVGFFLLSFFSCLWLGTEIPCHENMTKPQTKTQLGPKPSPNSPGNPWAGPTAGAHSHTTPGPSPVPVAGTSFTGGEGTSCFGDVSSNPV